MVSFILSPEVRRNPFPWYDEMRGTCPLLHDPRTDTWALFSYAAVKRAMNDHETFSSRVSPPGGKPAEWLVFLDPPRHTRMRALVMRAFTPRAIAALEPRIRELSAGLLDPLLARGEMELVADYATPLPTLVIAEMLGIPLADRARFAEWSRIIVNLSYAITGGEAAARAARDYFLVKDEMRVYFGDLIAARRAVAADDLLTRLVEGEVDGVRLSDEEILGFAILLLSAATETTTNLIDNAVLCLTEHPDQLARLRAAPTLLSSAVEEVVRYRSPGQIMFRQTTREVKLHGQVIPADRFVLTVVGSANRDPVVFADPDRFDIGRDPNPHVGFGHGIHYCLGAALARLEAKVALTHLLERMTHIALASDEPWEPRDALHVHGPARLPIRFEAARQR